MLLNKYQQRQKTALAHSRELNKLCRGRWTGQWQPCTPFQHGWFRDYVLRDDVSRRRDAADLKLILAQVGSRQWCKEHDFTTRVWGGKGRGKTEAMPPPAIKPLVVRKDRYTGEEIEWPLPQGFKVKYFHYHPVNAAWCDCFGRNMYYRPAHYYFKFPWMFDLRIRPAIISKLPVVDGDVESRIAWLENHMEHYDEWNVLRHMLGQGGYRCESVKHKLLDDAISREVKEEVEFYNEPVIP